MASLVPLDGPPLIAAGRLVQEDLCLLEKPEAAAEHVLTGAILCFPSNWTLAAEAGQGARAHPPAGRALRRRDGAPGPAAVRRPAARGAADAGQPARLFRRRSLQSAARVRPARAGPGRRAFRSGRAAGAAAAAGDRRGGVLDPHLHGAARGARPRAADAARSGQARASSPACRREAVRADRRRRVGRERARDVPRQGRALGRVRPDGAGDARGLRARPRAGARVLQHAPSQPPRREAERGASRAGPGRGRARGAGRGAVPLHPEHRRPARAGREPGGPPHAWRAAQGALRLVRPARGLPRRAVGRDDLRRLLADRGDAARRRLVRRDADRARRDRRRPGGLRPLRCDRHLGRGVPGGRPSSPRPGRAAFRPSSSTSSPRTTPRPSTSGSTDRRPRPCRPSSRGCWRSRADARGAAPLLAGLAGRRDPLRPARRADDGRHGRGVLPDAGPQLRAARVPVPDAVRRRASRPLATASPRPAPSASRSRATRGARRPGSPTASRRRWRPSRRRASRTR